VFHSRNTDIEIDGTPPPGRLHGYPSQGSYPKRWSIPTTPLPECQGFDAAATRHQRRETYGVNVGHVRVGGGAPIVVQSMNTDTADAAPGKPWLEVNRGSLNQELVMHKMQANTQTSRQL